MPSRIGWCFHSCGSDGDTCPDTGGTEGANDQMQREREIDIKNQVVSKYFHMFSETWQIKEQFAEKLDPKQYVV